MCGVCVCVRASECVGMHASVFVHVNVRTSNVITTYPVLPCRLMFGTTQLYVFCMPKKPEPEATFESAQEEIAANSGEIDTNSDYTSKGETQ